MPLRLRTCAVISALSLLTLLALPFPAPVALGELAQVQRPNQGTRV